MRQKSVFACQECGYTSPKWIGRCPDCGKWNTLVEELSDPGQAGAIHRKIADDEHRQPQPITDVKASEQERLKSGIEEFDRVLGGGAVPGSVSLIGGDPGIGKSTILLQATDRLSQKYGIHMAGEGGEYETLVVDAPFFSKKIELVATKKNWYDDHGTLEVLKTRLKDK